MPGILLIKSFFRKAIDFTLFKEYTYNTLANTQGNKKPNPHISTGFWKKLEKVHLSGVAAPLRCNALVLPNTLCNIIPFSASQVNENI